MSVLPLTIDSDYKVLICAICQYALKPALRFVVRHLVEAHSTPESAITKIETEVRQMLAGTELVEPQEAELKPMGSSVDTRLKVHRGVECQACQHICSTEKKHVVHSKKVHGITVPPTVSVVYQTWSYVNKAKGKWIIAQGPLEKRDTPVTTESIGTCIPCGPKRCLIMVSATGNNTAY